ncbi:glycosyltransferase [Micromonospora terminaliae]|uniref:Glycosyltransferase n=1 Tax=Micromonospora terminaliae TaxID=1914461 RepID=A0AAJ2ZIU8_9ACTN|nr:glycosyltransferase family 4 protein [Micromonospora terminaliae]NES30521.1 glycosyltransferase family 4 protein [Micromonospora terminaliae]QGL46556.1 glycosyltransferase [Micromonospora terminaliae]
MRIGFACLWDSHAPSTWSGTPWHLRAALRRQADIADVGVEVPQRTRLALSAMHPRWRNGRLSTMWEQSRTGDAYCRIKIRSRARRLGCDAVLQIQDLTPLDRPYFVYQDMSFDALIKMVDAGQPIFRQLSRDELLRRRERQHRVYERAAGVFAMSHWLARSLVEDSHLPATKVHVLHPGLHLDTRAGLATDQPPPLRPEPRRRLLFVGRTFHSKGGDLALEALRILRRDVDPAITLTVAGPPSWPLPGPVPDGVDFRGAMSRREVALLYDTHDLFVLPTRIEGFGLVFAEALARGLPCVGRDAFAMPEMIRPGVNGGLLSKDDPAELASLIAMILADDEIYSSCRAGSSEVASWFSWDRSAGEAINTIATTLGRTATTTSAPRRNL